jgi:hypothetical protein
MSGRIFWVNRFFVSMFPLTAPLKSSIPVLIFLIALFYWSSPDAIVPKIRALNNHYHQKLCAIDWL